MRPYNITNPGEFITGGTANVEELGTYPILVDNYKDNIVFSKANGTISWDDWGTTEPKISELCDGCSITDEINIFNYGYMNILRGVRHEGLILLNSACTATQIGLILNPASIPYCKTSQMGNAAATCKCCSVTAVANATLCSNIMSPSTQTGGLLSWLSMYDNGIKVNSNPSAYALSSGTYSSLIRKVAVTELMFGTVSSVMGLLSTGTALSSTPTAATATTLRRVGNTTQDIKDACYTYSSGCPQVSAIIGAVTGGGGMAYLKTVNCDGRVPHYTKLIDNGMSETRALELRYLEGVSCRPFTPAVVMAAQLTMDSGSTKLCLDGSTAMPCCLKMFIPSGGKPSAGVGCLIHMGGILFERKIYSHEETKGLTTKSEISVSTPDIAYHFCSTV